MNPLQKALLAEVKANIEEYWGEGAFEATYLRERHTCVPEDYLGDDIHNAIHDLFYAVFRPIADMVEKRTGMALVSVVVEADYENSTRVILYGHYEGQKDVLLLVVWRKAWHLWWNSPEEMGRDLEAWYNQALKAARTRTRYAFAISEEDVMLTARDMGVEFSPAQLNWVMEHLSIPDWQDYVEEYIRLALEQKELR